MQWSVFLHTAKKMSAFVCYLKIRFHCQSLKQKDHCLHRTQDDRASYTDPTWQNQRQPVTFNCGNLQWVLASLVWRLTDCRLLQNRCSNWWDGSSCTPSFYPKTVSRHGCLRPKLNTHFDFFCENAVLPGTGRLLVFNVTCHIYLDKGRDGAFLPGCSLRFGSWNSERKFSSWGTDSSLWFLLLIANYKQNIFQIRSQGNPFSFKDETHCGHTGCWSVETGKYHWRMQGWKCVGAAEEGWGYLARLWFSEHLCCGKSL